MDTVSEVKIENLSNWLKSLRLNSGTTLHIPPRATSQAIAGNVFLCLRRANYGQSYISRCLY